MAELISPEFDLDAFCSCMLENDLSAVMDAISEEITEARFHHRTTTKERNFRKGSRGRAYCEDLQRLLCMLINGCIVENSTPEFLWAVKPLFQRLLQEWEMGNLRQVFQILPKPKVTGCLSVPDTLDPLVVVVSRAEVEAMDTAAALGSLQRLIESPDTARKLVERVDIAFHGYDDVSWELPEITQVRDFVHELDLRFPYWLFFLSKRHLGLQCLLFCFLPPFLTKEARTQIYPKEIAGLLTRRWLPAMNQICQYVNFSEDQAKRLTQRAIPYVARGRFPLDSERFRG